MLEAGFTSIAYLRSRLMPAAKQGDTKWDDALQGLGLSVARRFESHCGRELTRKENAVEQYAARTLGVTVKRYPIEEIVSIELRSAGNLLTPISTAYQVDESAGLVDFYTIPGSVMQRLIITLTGGYWLDPQDGTEMPESATPLPEDIREAWITQIQITAEARGLFEAAALRPSQKGEQGSRTGNLTLSEDVVAVLRPYRRIGGE